MHITLHFLFAWRYFKAKKSTNAINVIAWISIGAIIMGTVALILVLSVFNGFEDLVKSLYSSFYTDLKIKPASGKHISVTAEQLNRLRAIKEIAGFSRVIEEKALLQNEDYQSVVHLMAVDDAYRQVTGVADHIVSGQYDLGTAEAPKLILGTGVEGALGIAADRNLFYLKIILPRKSKTEQIDPLNDISNDNIQSSSSFQIQQDFDTKYAITNLDYARQALRLDSNLYSGIEIRLRDPNTADDVKKTVEKVMGPGYLVQTRYEQNQSLYSVMNMERWIIYGVLSLILVVAAFNMIGALTMLVLEKQKDIGVLHALGGSRRFIQRIFLSEGLLLALVGTVIGMLLATFIAWLQINFHLIPLEGGTFLINYFPIKLRVADFLLVGATVLVISLLASWLPSTKAARHQFSLRSE
ncbi:MAG: FtsX-like permease family protein [Chitinophagaceae bacterium]